MAPYLYVASRRRRAWRVTRARPELAVNLHSAPSSHARQTRTNCTGANPTSRAARTCCGGVARWRLVQPIHSRVGDRIQADQCCVQHLMLLAFSAATLVVMAQQPCLNTTTNFTLCTTFSFKAQCEAADNPGCCHWYVPTQVSVLLPCILQPYETRTSRVEQVPITRRARW